MTGNEITKEEFIARFQARMAERCPDQVDGEAGGQTLAEYAAQVAEAAWDEPEQREEGPEACADADMSYWED